MRNAKPLTPAARERLARQYRLMAGRLYVHLKDRTAERANAQGAIQAAHDALCRAFTAIEDGVR